MKRFLPLLAVSFAFRVISLFAAPPTPPDGFTFVKDVGGIAEYRLSVNDLNVLLLEDHSAPVLTVHGHVPRWVAQRGHGHYRCDPLARAPDVQGEQKFPRGTGQASPSFRLIGLS